jgi:hypothetical protein
MSSSIDTLWPFFHRDLGVYGLARFLRVYRGGTGDYARDRQQPPETPPQRGERPQVPFTVAHRWG